MIRVCLFTALAIFLSTTHAPAADPPAKSERFAPEKNIDVGDGHLQCVQFSPDGKTVAACGDRFISAFDIESGELTHRFEGHSEDIFRFAFSPDGRFVASGSRDKTIRVLDAKTGDSVAVLEGHTDKIIGVNFSNDSQWLASGSTDGTVRVWDSKTWNEASRANVRSHTNAMFVAFSPDAKNLVTAEYRGGVSVFRFHDRRLDLQYERSHDGGEMTPHVVFRNDGQVFVTSSWDKTIRMWETQTGNLVWKRSTPPYARCFEASLFSPDATKLYSVTRDETIQCRDAETGRLIRARRWNDEVRGFAVSPDGSLLATGGHRGKIKLWSAAWFE